MRALTFVVGLALATGAEGQASTYIMALQLVLGLALIWIALPGERIWPRS